MATWADVERIGLALPETTLGTSTSLRRPTVDDSGHARAAEPSADWRLVEVLERAETLHLTITPEEPS